MYISNPLPPVFTLKHQITTLFNYRQINPLPSLVFSFKPHTTFPIVQPLILPLEIKSGRHTRKKLTERLCRLCDCNVEDKIHFICSCPNLNNIRFYHFSKLNIDFGENYMEQFIEVLCHSDLKTMVSFIYEMWTA